MGWMDGSLGGVKYGELYGANKLSTQMTTVERAGKSRRREWAEFGPSLNSGAGHLRPRRHQGRFAGGAVRPEGPVGLGGAVGGLGPAGRRRPAMELPPVCD